MPHPAPRPSNAGSSALTSAPRAAPRGATVSRRTLTRDHTLREPINERVDLLAASRECLRRTPLGRPLRLLGVRVSALVPVADVAENPGVWEQGELAFDE
ncbi:hypothetical protein [Ectothiorhodospira magna]|uniref:DinB/UmuC family translesion DNA polymerase n=1 Tax=Ectothiorhodospira magna TaxID=867345 RepID=UPI000B7EA633|nr:hypothetical protein [Ectothiorhodospira magna]